MREPYRFALLQGWVQYNLPYNQNFSGPKRYLIAFCIEFTMLLETSVKSHFDRRSQVRCIADKFEEKTALEFGRLTDLLRRVNIPLRTSDFTRSGWLYEKYR